MRSWPTVLVATILFCTLQGSICRADAKTDDPIEKVNVDVTKAVNRLIQLVDQRKVNKVTGEEPLGLFIVDTKTGKSRAVAMEPMAGLAHCGSPCWSRDGRRILFDVSPGKNYAATRLQSIDIINMNAEPRELGAGNCPTISPDGKKIAYLSNVGERGIWIMDADGANKKHLGGYGRPAWSPGGRHILIASFSKDSSFTLMDPKTGAETPIKLEGYKFHTIPSWGANDNTVLSNVSWEGGRGLATIDITEPDKAKIKQMIYEGDLYPMCPAYSAVTDTYFFIGAKKGNALYSIRPGRDQEPKPLEPDRERESKLYSLFASPDGRYLLFGSDRSPDDEEKPATE